MWYMISYHIYHSSFITYIIYDIIYHIHHIIYNISYHISYHIIYHSICEGPFYIDFGTRLYVHFKLRTIPMPNDIVIFIHSYMKTKIASRLRTYRVIIFPYHISIYQCSSCLSLQCSWSPNVPLKDDVYSTILNTSICVLQQRYYSM